MQFRFLQFFFFRDNTPIDRTEETPYVLGTTFFFRRDGNFCFMDTRKLDGARSTLHLSEDGRRLCLTDEELTFVRVETDEGDALYRGQREIVCDNVVAAHFKVDSITVVVVTNPDVFQLDPIERTAFVNPRGLHFNKTSRQLSPARSFGDDS
ncbi:hypothetical protein HYW18_02230 [Candidatus Uhrbacteria bacterium]|nr:hypothetical protein [Candidatus Uhrbacteria bacterium]